MKLFSSPSHRRLGCAVLLPAILWCAINCPAQARLGEEFAAFQTRILHSYEQAGQRNGNFFFKLRLTPRQKQLAPGYAVGITATVVDGKIVGESMACVIGNNQPLGSALAALDAFTFTCEATGKPLPREQKQAQMEFRAFATIVQSAFNGQLQTYAYPGYPSKISIMVDKTRRLIIACSPQQTAASPPPPPGVTNVPAGKPASPRSAATSQPAKPVSKKTNHK